MRKIFRSIAHAFRSLLGINRVAAAVRDVRMDVANTFDVVRDVRAAVTDVRAAVTDVRAAVTDVRAAVTNATSALRVEMQALAQALGLPKSLDAFVTVNLPNGTTYELSIVVGESDPYHKAVASTEAYEPNWHFLNAWLRPGDVFFDLGANIGTIAIPAAVNGAVVHAFELLEENVRHLTRSVHKNSLKNVSIVVGALSDKDGFVGMAGSSAWGTIDSGSLVSVSSVVIDTYVQRKAVRVVNIMKMDIEGSEMSALHGATALIERDHPDILIECNAVTCGTFGYSYRDLLRFLATHGYDLYRLHQNRLCPWTADSLQEVIFSDYFATTKAADEVVARSGWSISALTNEDVVSSVLQQELYGHLHQQFVRAIKTRLPAAVLADARVTQLLDRWSTLVDDPQDMAVLQTGSA